MSEKQVSWDWEIKHETTWLGTSFKELYSYKDLLFRLVRKEFLASYQQTLLGPLWVVLLPVLTVLTYVLVFHKMIGISTEGFPPLLFYLTGITLWNLFSDVFLAVIPAFSQNAAVFSKVYFPRIIVPLSILLLNSIRFSVQLILLLIVLFYFYVTGKVDVHVSTLLYSIPAIIITAGIAFGAGLLFSIITIKYRDLLGLIQFVMRLFMFLCPIFYSLAMVPQKIKWVVMLNPLSTQFELFRYAFLGKGLFSGMQILYSTVAMLVLVISGILLFNKTGDKLMDVI